MDKIVADSTLRMVLYDSNSFPLKSIMMLMSSNLEVFFEKAHEEEEEEGKGRVLH